MEIKKRRKRKIKRVKKIKKTRKKIKEKDKKRKFKPHFIEENREKEKMPKKKLRMDIYGKPLTNTSRVNIDTSKKKAPKERLENTSRLEISVGKKKEKIERRPESRKHERVLSSKKKRKVSLDKYGKPLTNTSRVNYSISK